MSRQWRRLLAAFALVPVLAVAGCSASSTKSDEPTTGYHTEPDPIRPPASEEAEHNGGSLCGDPELAESSKYDAYCNPRTDPNATLDLTRRVKFRSALAPHSTQYAGRVNVEAFLLNVQRSQREVWREYFTGSNFDVPDFGADIVTGTEKYTSNCTNGLARGPRLVIKANSDHPLYCWLDHRPYGHIALPASTFAKLWDKYDRPAADMTAAIVVSRVGSQQLNQALILQLGAGSGERFYGASCLAGVWAHTVYPRSTADQLDEALKYAKQIPGEIGDETSPVDPYIDIAWQAGYSSGSPSVCSQPMLDQTLDGFER